MKNNNYRYRLYGRSRGRKKNNQINSLVSEIKINKLEKSRYNIIDIGSGYGESSLEIAKKNIKHIVVACEKYIDGINNIAEKVKCESIDNLFIYQGNVHQFFDEYCIEKLISEIWILFPDPWPKKRHNKRRLINIDFLKKVRYFLKKNANLFIATDSTEYLESIIINIYKLKDLYLWKNQDPLNWHYRYLNLPATKFSKKAEKSNRKSIFLQLKKI